MREFILRTRNYLLILLMIYLAYSAITYFANNSAPKCADKKTIENVYSIFKETIFPRQGATQEQISNANIELSNIITLDTNSVGAYFCQGDLTVKLDNQNVTYNVTYNNRLIEDSKNQFLTSITSYK